MSYSVLTSVRVLFPYCSAQCKPEICKLPFNAIQFMNHEQLDQLSQAHHGADATVLVNLSWSYVPILRLTRNEVACTLFTSNSTELHHTEVCTDLLSSSSVTFRTSVLCSCLGAVYTHIHQISSVINCSHVINCIIIPF